MHDINISSNREKKREESNDNLRQQLRQPGQQRAAREDGARRSTISKA
ncbi:hypothetical protein BVRB_7g164720 [Beta vulgaris subsp. vulgaris]|nr:hypothetical protein BVRB_7g164720 [Beta vulgaris subsp. vulgaris]